MGCYAMIVACGKARAQTRVSATSPARIPFSDTERGDGSMRNRLCWEGNWLLGCSALALGAGWGAYDDADEQGVANGAGYAWRIRGCVAGFAAGGLE
jgi:hypothetical protein